MSARALPVRTAPCMLGLRSRCSRSTKAYKKCHVRAGACAPDTLVSFLRHHEDLKAIKPEKEVMFPMPPWPGTSSITPICDLSALRREGAEMNHCVGSLGKKVAAGSTYFYKVMAPKRATLSVSRVQGIWSLGEFLGPSNQELEPKDADEVWRLLTAT